MSASKRPSTSSLRRFITSRPYVTVAELRRRFGLDDPDAMALLQRNGTVAWIGLPEREAAKLQDLWSRDELGVELSVEVNAPVAVGVYPMRIARYVTDGNGGVSHMATNGQTAAPNGAPSTNGTTSPAARQGAPAHADGLPIYAERAGNPH
ncbi:MAG TPA: hypothetical protein VFL75_04815 [Candidatus Limnocylindria bacterium]|jgi:hypothetical protein|nr:hypothetical protein [Candidatus Limnocylindria bacterium]